MKMDRRSFLSSLTTFVAAPAIVRASSLMVVSPFLAERRDVTIAWRRHRMLRVIIDVDDANGLKFSWHRLVEHLAA